MVAKNPHPLIRRFWEICLLRAGPQDLPTSTFLLALTLAAYLASGVVLMLVEGEPGPAFGQVALDAALLGAVTWLLLTMRGLGARMVQSYSALTGSGTLLNLIALPVALILTSLQQSGGDVTLFALLWIALIFWSVLVSAHIFRHALAVPFPAGMVVALGYMVLIIELTRRLFPTETP